MYRAQRQNLQIIRRLSADYPQKIIKTVFELNIEKSLNIQESLEANPWWDCWWEFLQIKSARKRFSFANAHQIVHVLKEIVRSFKDFKL